jgi:hypothetical protein
MSEDDSQLLRVMADYGMYVCTVVGSMFDNLYLSCETSA